MLAPFAALESRLNSAVQNRLANAVAVYQGGEPFGVLFERTPADPFGGGVVAASSTSCAFGIAHAPGLVQGAELSIDGVPYIVAGDVLPDASGWVALAIYPKD